MSNQWFRMYAEVLNDPKVQKLPAELFKTWVNILCFACNGNGTFHETLEDVSFALRMSVSETKTAFQQLEKSGLIVTVNETFQIHNWKKRQYKSDISTSRVHKHRNAKRNVSETPPEQIQNRYRTEQNKVSKVIGQIPENLPRTKKQKVIGTRLTPEWTLPQEWGEWAETQGLSGKEIILEGDKFRDYWIAKTGANATKANWEATWRNWIRNKNERKKA